MRTIFFDLFETLVTQFNPAWSPPPLTHAQRLGLSEEYYRAHWPDFDRAWQAGEIPTYSAALSALCSAAGHQPDAAVVAQLTAEFAREIAGIYAALEPEIIAMLAALKAAGFKLGVITNAGDLDTALWPTCALTPHFDDFVASHQVRMLKREPQIFELACDRLGVAPGNALFIGDGGGDELRGATTAGVAVYWSTWFLDRWPDGRRPNGFPGDDWRQATDPDDPPFTRLARPADLLRKLIPDER